MNSQILIINAGSSSIKYSVYALNTNNVVAEGLCERIGIDGNFIIKFDNKKEELNADFSNHEKALNFLFNFLESKKILDNRDSIVGVGHRIVQGGRYFKDSTILKKLEITKIKEYIPLAPLHNEPEVLIVEQMAKILPKAVNVGVFDTSFHQTLKPENKYYALNFALAEKLQIQRYGFHGTSYKYITGKMQQILAKNKVNLIVCHLGNGASISAIQNNLSINTSMGLTPLEGLVMGTRSGDIDPGIINYLAQQLKIDSKQIDQMLNKESGLLGLSGSSDMRDVIAGADSNNSEAKLALDIFCKRVADYIVKYANDLEGQVDAIVFTAGIGENAARTREIICAKTPLLQLVINQKTNAAKIGSHQLISAPESKIPVYVVRTNEELMIFNDVKRLLKL